MNVQELQMNTTQFEAVIEKCSFLGVTRESLDICDGNWATARLLSAIIYWFRAGANGDGRTRVFRDGLYWVAHTAEEWRADLSLTEWEFRTALDGLEAMGLITRRSMKYKYLKQLHLSLDKNKLVAMIKAVRDSHDYPHAAVDPVPPSMYASVPFQLGYPTIVPIEAAPKSVLSASQDDSTEGSEKSTKALKTGDDEAVAKSADQFLPKSSTVGEVIEEKKKGEMKTLIKEENALPEYMLASDYEETPEYEQEWQLKQSIKQSLELEVADKKAHACAPGLDGLWQRLTGQEVKTPKQRKQLYLLGQDFGLTIAYQVVSHAVHNWIEFGHRAASNTGSTSFADKPNIGYLSKHRYIALDLYLKSLNEWESKKIENELEARHEAKAHAKFIKFLQQYPDLTNEENDAALEALCWEFYEISDLSTKWLHDYEAVHGTVSNGQVHVAA
jgi:hypothetical protein